MCILFLQLNNINLYYKLVENINILYFNIMYLLIVADITVQLKTKLNNWNMGVFKLLSLILNLLMIPVGITV